MEGYIGEIIVNQKDTIFKDYSEKDWALYFIERYGGIDGEHHKNWVMDQVARILNGVEVIIKLATWENGHEEYRVYLGEPTDDYHDWVREITNGEDGSDTYDYDIGTPP